MIKRDLILAPSILAADYLHLGEQVQAVVDSGVHHLHVDVMDGHFVPNLSFGPSIVAALRPFASQTRTTLDVHLMIDNPDQYLQQFADAGADILTVHVEACVHLHRTIQAIREFGMRPGVTLNPATPLHTLEEILPDVDLVLVMSVNPGYGGQHYIPASTAKIRRLRGMLDAIGSQAMLEVDGGIKVSNIAEVAAAGATVFVSGSGVFGGPQTVAENIEAMNAALMGSRINDSHSHI